MTWAFDGGSGGSERGSPYILAAWLLYDLGFFVVEAAAREGVLTYLMYGCCMTWAYLWWKRRRREKESLHIGCTVVA
jgi:hypothetical protein